MNSDLGTLSLEVDAPFLRSEAAQFLYLDQRAVLQAGVLDMCCASDVLSETLSLFENGKCRQPHKVVLKDGDDVNCEARGRINGLFASIGGALPAVGMKWVASFPSNRGRGLPRASALIVLNSSETGLPLAIMDGTLISAMRTGAVTALGAKYLAPHKSQKAGIIGAGVQVTRKFSA